MRPASTLSRPDALAAAPLASALRLSSKVLQPAAALAPATLLPPEAVLAAPAVSSLCSSKLDFGCTAAPPAFVVTANVICCRSCQSMYHS